MRAGSSGERPSGVPVLLDELLSALQIPVADCAVHVDHALLEPLEEVVVERAIVERVACLHAETIPEERQEVAQWVHEPVHGLADAVTNGQRLHERQDEIGPGARAPETERLAEVLAALVDAPVVLGRVEQAADAGRAVDEEAADLSAGAAPLALQQAV